MRNLFLKYLNNTISADELKTLCHYCQLDENDAEIDVLIKEYFQTESSADDAVVYRNLEKQREDSWESIEKRLKVDRAPKRLTRSFTFKLSIAASVLILGSFSFYMIGRLKPDKTQVIELQDLQSNRQQAKLIVSDGTVYDLNGKNHEVISDESGIRYKNGDTLAKVTSSKLVTLLTPRGGNYTLTLEDGTRVWLNAQSSLRYPISFNGVKERVVELQGEAYFEVAHNSKQPFIVNTAIQKVKVLGTSFNINAYANENRTITTLVTGRVQINDKSDRKLQVLAPLQQASNNGTSVAVEDVDTDLYTAWKEGTFRFRSTPLPDALRQIERWYDLEIDYKDIPENIKIHALISRDSNLSTVLHALEKITGLKFNVKGRSVHMMK
ncbi:FecR domain-containing protein [Sphingobacterium sp.]|uniref:FecR family protein n=1 Tax=Sphingobacterium sp. TaxID=341027 RepID=UPI00289EC2FA|nr:FecR domain-containing protein [Sphingobacterium sp.]